MSSEIYHGTVLPDVGGHGDSEATAINNAGDIVGYSDTGSGSEAVEWRPNGTATVLPDVGGHGDSEATAINNAGDIVGYSETSSGKYEAVEWSPTGNSRDPPSPIAPHVAVSDPSTSAIMLLGPPDPGFAGSEFLSGAVGRFEQPSAWLAGSSLHG